MAESRRPDDEEGINFSAEGSEVPEPQPEEGGLRGFMDELFDKLRGESEEDEEKEKEEDDDSDEDDAKPVGSDQPKKSLFEDFNIFGAEDDKPSGEEVAEQPEAPEPPDEPVVRGPLPIPAVEFSPDEVSEEAEQPPEISAPETIEADAEDNPEEEDDSIVAVTPSSPAPTTYGRATPPVRPTGPANPNLAGGGPAGPNTIGGGPTSPNASPNAVNSPDMDQYATKKEVVGTALGLDLGFDYFRRRRDRKIERAAIQDRKETAKQIDKVKDQAKEQETKLSQQRERAQEHINQQQRTNEKLEQRLRDSEKARQKEKEAEKSKSPAPAPESVPLPKIEKAPEKTPAPIEGLRQQPEITVDRSQAEQKAETTHEQGHTQEDLGTRLVLEQAKQAAERDVAMEGLYEKRHEVIGNQASDEHFAALQNRSAPTGTDSSSSDDAAQVAAQARMKELQDQVARQAADQGPGSGTSGSPTYRKAAISGAITAVVILGIIFVIALL